MGKGGGIDTSVAFCGLDISSMGTFTIDHIEISSLLVLFCIPLSCFYVSSCLNKRQGKCLFHSFYLEASLVLVTLQVLKKILVE